MRILDGKSPHFGYFPLQDWGWTQQGVEQHARHCLVGVRLLSKQTGKGDVGTAHEDPEQRADLGGFMFWPRSSRSINTAREIFFTMGEPTATTPSTSGPITPSTGPAGEITPNSRTPYGPTTPSSGSSGGGFGANDSSGESLGGPIAASADPGGGVGGGPGGNAGDGAPEPPPDSGSQTSNGSIINRTDGDVGWNPDTGWEYSENGGGGPQTQSEVPNTDRDQEGIVWDPDSGWEYPENDTDGDGIGSGGEKNGGPGGDGKGGGGDGGGKKSKPMIPEPVKNQPHGSPVTAVFPCGGPTPEPDKRFGSLRPAVPEVGGRKVWPAFPRGYLTITGMGTDEDDQNEYLGSVDPRLIAANRGNPAYGSLVCDVSGHNIDTSRQASLQSMMRVIRAPAGQLSFQGNTRNVIAWNIGADGRAATLGGLVADHGNKRTWTAAVSVRDGGPFDTTDGCKHKIAESADGEPVSPLHLSTMTLFRNEAGEKQKDGPIKFETDWPDPTDFFYPALTHFGYDEKAEYRWPRDSRERTDTGMWRLYTRIVIAYGGGGETIEPPQTPGGDGPEPPQTPGGEGGDPPTGPTTPSPGDGGRGSVGGGENLPGTGAGRSSTPNGQGGESGGGDRAQTNVGLPRTITAGNSLVLVPRPYARTHVRTAFPEILAKPVLIRKGLNDIAALARPDRDQQDRYHDENPLTGRLVAYGAQGGTAGGPHLEDSGEWARTQGRGSSRHIGGTASGGWVLLPPEVDMSDVDDDFAPAGVTRSATYLTAAPGTSIGFGMPDLATGGLRSGVSARVEGGELNVYSHDAIGSETLVATFRQGAIELADGANLKFGTSTGTQIGTGPTEKLSFWGDTPVVRSSGWSTTGGSTNKVVDAASPVLADIANNVKTIVDVLTSYGMLET